MVTSSAVVGSSAIIKLGPVNREMAIITRWRIPKKVVWPTKKELGSYTTYVLVTCAFFTLLFYAADTGILFGMKKLLGIDL